MFDLLLQGGTLIDGTGAPRRPADVGIRDGRILALEPKSEAASARRTIDARGLIVAPGFVDVHNHSDGWLLREMHLVPKTSQGFTTEVLMSDGISYAPLTPETVADWFVYLRPLNGLPLEAYRQWETLSDFMGLFDRRNVQHTVFQVPYANLRVLAAGWRRGPLDDSQLNLVRSELRRGMEAGAVGLSTGLDYVSQCFATTDELVGVCEAMAPYDGLYVSHVRYKEGVLRGVQEAVEIGRRAGVKVHISHLKGLSPLESQQLLEYIERVARHEVDFSFDVYPYMPGSTLLASLLPYEVWEDGPLGVTARLSDRALRRRIAMTLEGYKTPIDHAILAWVASRHNAPYVGRSLADYAAARGVPLEDAIADLLIEEQLAVTCVFRGMDDSLIGPFLQHPLQMLGSDGIYFPDGHVHPRVWGSAPRMLGPLVRERRLFSLEEAVRKLSGYPAARFGLVDRGEIRPGAWADLVVFDPDTITDRATFEDPHQQSEGIHSVMVGGQLIFSDGAPVHQAADALPGRVLRYKQATV
jgi:N-acyl-D-amino-acid deacylase